MYLIIYMSRVASHDGYLNWRRLTRNIINKSMLLNTSFNKRFADDCPSEVGIFCNVSINPKIDEGKAVLVLYWEKTPEELLELLVSCTEWRMMEQKERGS